MRRTRLLRAAAIAGLAALAATVPASGGGTAPALTVVAKNLDNPRKLFLAGDGALYVVEAGRGGSDKCFGTGPDSICVGLTGAITMIDGGRQTRIVRGLVSWATPVAQRAQGAADVLVQGRTFYVLFGDALANARGGNDLGPDGAAAGRLIATPPGRAVPHSVANMAAFEAAHNPDRGAGPGRKLGNPSVDSNPFAFTPYRGGYAVVDAAANDLLWIDGRGRMSVLAVFPTQTLKLTKAEAKLMGAPAGVTSLPIQAVPSSVVAGPDGALYVGELTGRPFRRGAARVWRVVPGKKPALYARGFTNIADLAFAGRNLLVLEFAARGLWDPPWNGALVRVAPDGSKAVVASRGLVAPTGLAVGRRSIFVSNYGFFPGSGPGPHGQVVKLPRAAAAS